MTLKEYLEDYASPETVAAGNRLIDDQIGDIPNERIRQVVAKRLDAIAGGARDFRI